MCRTLLEHEVLTDSSLLPQHQAEEKAVQSLTSTSNRYWMAEGRVGLPLQVLQEQDRQPEKAVVPTAF